MRLPRDKEFIVQSSPLDPGSTGGPLAVVAEADRFGVLKGGSACYLFNSFIFTSYSVENSGESTSMDPRKRLLHKRKRSGRGGGRGAVTEA